MGGSGAPVVVQALIEVHLGPCFQICPLGGGPWGPWWLGSRGAGLVFHFGFGDGSGELPGLHQLL